MHNRDNHSQRNSLHCGTNPVSIIRNVNNKCLGKKIRQVYCVPKETRPKEMSKNYITLFSICNIFCFQMHVFSDHFDITAYSISFFTSLSSFYQVFVCNIYYYYYYYIVIILLFIIYVYRILNKFPVSDEGNHLALGVMSENPRIILHFNGLGAKPQTNGRIREIFSKVKILRNMEYNRVDKALKMTLQMYNVENGARKHARKVI